MPYPIIIQSGMGVAVSGWPLARAVSRLGQHGVVSGTALAVVLARRLQLGDPSDDLRNALARFPFPHMAARVLADYFIRGGKPPAAPFKLTPMPTLHPRRELVELTVVANFVEVFLAKEGHQGPVGINYLEKIQLPKLPSLCGAVLAGVDYILMGAGIPRTIPGVLNLFAQGQSASLPIDVQGALPGEKTTMTFDPREFCGAALKPLKSPTFVGIVASATLALALVKKASGRVDGFVVEGPTAGGHNAPPRGQLQLTPQGEPLYGPRDVPELDKIQALGLPFWLAGGYGHPGKLAEALQLGAAGIQVGTPFAFCEESGIHPELKRQALALSRLGQARVFTDPVTSPTGFPFKVAQLENTLSNAANYHARHRDCDLGYLRHLYRRADGTIGYRCPAEPLEQYRRKASRFLLPPALGTGLLKPPSPAELFQRLLAIQLVLEPAYRPLYRFAPLQFDFSRNPGSACSGAASRRPPVRGRRACVSLGTGAPPLRPSDSLSPLGPERRSNRNHHRYTLHPDRQTTAPISHVLHSVCTSARRSSCSPRH